MRLQQLLQLLTLCTLSLNTVANKVVIYQAITLNTCTFIFIEHNLIRVRNLSRNAFAGPKSQNYAKLQLQT